MFCKQQTAVAVFTAGLISTFHCAFAQLNSLNVRTVATTQPHAIVTAGADANTASSQEETAALEQLKPVVAIAGQWMKRPELQNSYVGLEIMDVPSGRVIFSANGSKRFVSASIAKVLTTACAYDTFGGAYSYRTQLLGYGDLRGNKLNGPLVIAGSEDPTFSYSDLRELLGCLPGKLSAARGSLFVASAPGGGDHFSTEWLVQDFAQDWMPVSSDFVLDRNVVPARDAGRGYPLVTATAASVNNAMLKSLLQSPWAPAWVQFNPETNNVSYFQPNQPVTGALCVGNPTEFNAAVARGLLRSLGIKLENHTESQLGSAVVLGEHRSKALSEIIRFTLKESDNLYAQQLLRTLGTPAPINKSVEDSSLEERGLARLTAWLNGVGLPSGQAVLWDGCGLSRKNAIAPHALNVVLRHMCLTSNDAPFIDLMIHEGDGAAGTFRYKTGAMDSVRSICGVVRIATGQPIAVTAIINDHVPSVRELRASLNSLIHQLEGLGAVKLRPAPAAVTRPVHANINTAGKANRKKIRRRHR